MPKDKLAYAYLMGVEDDASTQDVIRALKEALCSAKPMGVENVAYSLGAPKVLKGALPYAKDMVGENVVSLTVGAYAQKVYMGARIFVLPMVVERDVLSLGAPKVHVEGPIAV